MGGRSPDEHVVYVPRRPGPLLTVQTLATPSDEIDEVLDDLFGAEDDRGPSATDAVLVAAGLGAVAVGQLTDMSGAITVVGVGLILLGAILPIRTGFRHLENRKVRIRSAAVIGDGIALRQDHPSLLGIAQLHDQVLAQSDQLVPAARARFAAVAHALVEEVATLLAGEVPVSAAEIDYVETRASALAELAATAADPRIGDGDPVRRQAVTEARIEIERIAGRSALTDCAELRDELLPGPDA